MTAMEVCFSISDEQSHFNAIAYSPAILKREHGEESSLFCIKRARLAIDSDPTPYSLPNEMLTKICEKMSPEDRKRFAAVDDRLNGIEEKAGGRRFKKIECSSNAWRPNMVKVCADPGKVIFVDTSPQPVTYFANATTESLSIKGHYEEESAKALLSVIATAICSKLLIELSDGHSIRLLKEVARAHKEIDEVSICIVKPKMDIDSARNAFLELHPMNAYHICVDAFQSPKSEFQANLIDDEVLLHLIANSRNSMKIDYHNFHITSAGIAEAFKMVCLSVSAKSVEFTMRSRELKECLRHLDYTKYERISDIPTIKHYHSGAYLDFFISDEFASVKMSCKGMQ